MNGLHIRFRSSRLIALAALFLVIAQGQALAAGAQAWTLQDSAGQVRLVKAGITPIALTVGDVFEGGDWIETGADGRAVLDRGNERIVVAPNSSIGLPRDNPGPFTTRIIQTLGTIMLTVEKKANQHFVVETPYLAAVVKGTTFTVGVWGKRAVVHVVEGLVQVQDLASGQRGMVRPGQTGVVLSGSNDGVSIQGGNHGAEAPAPPSETDGPKARQAASGEPAQSNAPDTVVIREALGPVKVDLLNATGGLMREASAPAKAPSPGEASAKPDDRGNRGAARTAHGRAANAGDAALSRGALGRGDALDAGNGRGVGKSATASGLAGSGPGAAAAGPPGRAVGLRDRANGVGPLGTPPGHSGSPARIAGPPKVNPGNGLGPLNNPGRGPLDNPGKGKRKK